MITSPTIENLFFAAMILNEITIDLHDDRKNLACTFLTKVKDPNYLDLNQSQDNKFIVSTYEQEPQNEQVSCSFKTKQEVQKFIDILCYLNSIDSI